MTEQKAPMWRDYLGQMPQSQVNAPYKTGTKTLGTKEMESANARHAAQLASQEQMHAQGLALDRERLALDTWVKQMENNYKLMTWEAYRADLAYDRAQGGIVGSGNNQFDAAMNTPYSGVMHFDLFGGGAPNRTYVTTAANNLRQQQPVTRQSTPITTQKQYQTLYGTPEERKYF